MFGPRLGHIWVTTDAKRRETMQNEIHTKRQVTGGFWTYRQVSESGRKPHEPASQAGNASSNLVGATPSEPPHSGGSDASGGGLVRQVGPCGGLSE